MEICHTTKIAMNYSVPYFCQYSVILKKLSFFDLHTMKHFGFLALLWLSLNGVFANNLQIGTPILSLNNELVFTISWDNSWHTTSAPNNWDAVYLFIKYRDCASSNMWSHVQLSTSASDHTVQAPLLIDTYKLSDGKGVIIRRSSAGSGSIAGDTVKLKITNPAVGSSYDFQVFGIEMVYVPTGSFYLGDGVSSNYLKDGSTSSTPLLATSDAALTKGTAVGNINALTPSSISGNIPAAFPIGYDSIYVMKYEVSQAQYAAFLNTLSSDQATARYNSSGYSNRTNIGGSWPNYTTLYPHRAMGYLSWQDLAAFLDWSALRPMTETEFEKICRGSNYPTGGEYAWGTAYVRDADVISNDGTTAETNTNIPPAGYGIANYNGDSIQGPLRGGFAASPSTNRMQAGATYYGVMEMSGNMGEFAVNLYEGLTFTGLNGDGVLSNTPSAGNANTSGWPSQAGLNDGIAVRGGDSSLSSTYLRVSDRAQTDVSTIDTRYYHRGGRGIR